MLNVREDTFAHGIPMMAKIPYYSFGNKVYY